MSYASEESTRRIARVRAYLDSVESDALYLRKTSNIAWISAIDDVFDEEEAHALYIDGENCIIHTDSRYSVALRHGASDCPLRIDDTRLGLGSWLMDVCDGCTEIAVESSMALGEFRALERARDEKRPSLTFAETSDVVFGLRSVKSPLEIERLKHAQAITDAAFSHIAGFARPGMTEREIQLELDGFMSAHGAQGLAFPTIVATGPNAASPHAQPRDNRLEAGQCVVMDFGAAANGYCSDMTRMLFVGQPDERIARAYETIRTANEEVEAMLAPGVKASDAHAHAEAVLSAGGFEGKMGHALGHGVGMDIHESPVLSPFNEVPLVPGNVVTVEPGIYIEDDFGMRLEDFGVVTEEGFEVFTQSTHDMVIL